MLFHPGNGGIIRLPFKLAGKHASTKAVGKVADSDVTDTRSPVRVA
jgi:hypothetical protein